MFKLEKLLSKEQALNFMQTNLRLFLEVTKIVRTYVKTGELTFYCEFCDEIRSCLKSDNWNLRNSIYCSRCNLNGRERHVYGVIKSLLERGNYQDRIIFEEITHFKNRLDEKFVGFLGCEYLGADKISGKKYLFKEKLITHQDILSTSFSSKSLDMVVTMDVLEHVPNIPIALSEINRILRKGGVHLMTIPFYDQQSSIKRAQIEIINGKSQLRNIFPPEFHGNPLSANGSLVFTEPGIDFLDTVENAGFDIRISLGANLEYGLLPDGNSNLKKNSFNLVFVTFKK